MREANLQGVTLRNINLKGTDLWGADLKGMKLRGVIDGLEWITNLEEWKVGGVWDIEHAYSIEDEDKEQELGLGDEKHIIREIKKGTIRGTHLVVSQANPVG